MLLLINFYFSVKTSNQQVIINQDLNTLKSKYGEFGQLISKNFSTSSIKFICPNGTEIVSSFMTTEEIGVTCKNVSNKVT